MISGKTFEFWHKAKDVRHKYLPEDATPGFNMADR
jgi:hypothetical protein